mgnify:CR=1 FL=1
MPLSSVFRGPPDTRSSYSTSWELKRTKKRQHHKIQRPAQNLATNPALLLAPYLLQRPNSSCNCASSPTLGGLPSTSTTSLHIPWGGGVIPLHVQELTASAPVTVSLTIGSTEGAMHQEVVFVLLGGQPRLSSFEMLNPPGGPHRFNTLSTGAFATAMA